MQRWPSSTPSIRMKRKMQLKRIRRRYRCRWNLSFITVVIILGGHVKRPNSMKICSLIRNWSPLFSRRFPSNVSPRWWNNWRRWIWETSSSRRSPTRSNRSSTIRFPPCSSSSCQIISRFHRAFPWRTSPFRSMRSPIARLRTERHRPPSFNTYGVRKSVNDERSERRIELLPLLFSISSRTNNLLLLLLVSVNKHTTYVSAFRLYYQWFSFLTELIWSNLSVENSRWRIEQESFWCKNSTLRHGVLIDCQAEGQWKRCHWFILFLVDLRATACGNRENNEMYSISLL